MLPDLETQLALTAQLVAAREDRGDEVEVPRSVDHLVRVARSRADALVADLEAGGFTVRNRRSRLRVSVEFDRDDAVDHGSAAAFTREVVEIALRHGAAYDGWGALVLPRGRTQYVPPADAMPLVEVPVGREQARLRTMYREQLVADGCPQEQAEALSRKVELRVAATSWALRSPSSSAVTMNHYSPSEADERLADLVGSAVSENARRRKPLWQSAG